MTKFVFFDGDKLDISIKNGEIVITPLAVYPKRYINDLKEEIDKVKTKIASWEQSLFDTVEDLLKKKRKNSGLKWPLL